MNILSHFPSILSVFLLLLNDVVSFDHERLVHTIHESSAKQEFLSLKQFGELVKKEVASSVCDSNDFECRQEKEGKDVNLIMNSLYLIEESDRQLKYEGILDRIYELTSTGRNNNTRSSRRLDEADDAVEESNSGIVYVILDAIFQIIYLLITSPIVLVVEILVIVVQTLVAILDFIEEPESSTTAAQEDDIFDRDEINGEVDDGAFISDFLESLEGDLVNWSSALDQTDQDAIEEDEDEVEVDSNDGEDRRFLRRSPRSSVKNIAQLDSMLEKVKNIASESEKHYTKKHQVLENIVLYGALGFVESKGDLATAATWSAMAYGHQVHFSG